MSAPNSSAAQQLKRSSENAKILAHLFYPRDDPGQGSSQGTCRHFFSHPTVTACVTMASINGKYKRRPNRRILTICVLLVTLVWL
jgi:hypothetical protein